MERTFSLQLLPRFVVGREVCHLDAALLFHFLIFRGNWFVLLSWYPFTTTTRTTTTGASFGRADEDVIERGSHLLGKAWAYALIEHR